MSSNSSKKNKNNSDSRLDILEMSHNPKNINPTNNNNFRSSSSEHDEGLLDDRFAPGTIDGDTQVNEMSTPVNNNTNFNTLNQMGQKRMNKKIAQMRWDRTSYSNTKKSKHKCQLQFPTKCDSPQSVNSALTR